MSRIPFTGAVCSMPSPPDSLPVQRRQPPRERSQGTSGTLDRAPSRSDLCLHNVHLLSKGATVANIGMPLQGQKSKLPVSVLAKPGNVHFKCDVHSWMDGYVHVFDQPWYAVTDKTGAFHIAGIPPGTYDLQVEHELLGGSMRKVTVAAGADTTVEVDLK